MTETPIPIREQIAPCPFCAEVPRLMPNTTIGGGILMHSCKILDNCSGQTACPCSGHNFTVEAWNTRIIDQYRHAPDAERAALVQRLRACRVACASGPEHDWVSSDFNVAMLEETIIALTPTETGHGDCVCEHCLEEARLRRERSAETQEGEPTEAVTDAMRWAGRKAFDEYTAKAYSRPVRPSMVEYVYLAMRAASEGDIK